MSASDGGTIHFWDVESGAEKGHEGTHGEALAGERFAFSKKDSKEQVVGSFIVTAQGDLVRVYEVDDAHEVDEGVADKDEENTTVAFFAAPSDIQCLACAGDKIAVGLQNGGVLHLRAPFLAAGG